MESELKAKTEARRDNEACLKPKSSEKPSTRNWYDVETESKVEIQTIVKEVKETKSEEMRDKAEMGLHVKNQGGDGG